MSQLYDTIVVGAGIAGCCTAFTLQERGENVLLVDRSAVAASGGSGAAGAFVSPKIGKKSPLHSITNEAFEFSKIFYTKYFPKHFHQTGVIRIPKDLADSEKFTEYEKQNEASYRWLEKDELLKLGIRNVERSFLFDEAAVCDAPELCREIIENVEFMQFEVESLAQESGIWNIKAKDINSVDSSRFIANCALHEEPKETLLRELKAKKVVLATGYENELFDMRYMGVKGTWGSRGDYLSSLPLSVSMHKSVSVSANIDGVIKVGASHVKSKAPCRVCDGEPLKGVFTAASEMVDTSDFVLKETFCGMRAGSKDYFPLAGRVIDVTYMLENYPKILKGAKPELKYIDNLYVCNGVGGRGFVFSPYISSKLAELMVDGEEMDSRIDPDRLFLKWCRKLKL